MRALQREEILGPDAYEAVRPGFRNAVMRLKQDRRLAVGDRVTLVFENRETIRFQVQEMIRVERIRDPAQVQQELDVYNELVPAAGELSATLFIEITERARIKSELDRLVGIDEHVSLILGDPAAPHVIRARFDPKQMEEERIAAVQYIKFTVPEAQIAHLADPALPARLRIDHPDYRHEAELPAALRRSLLEDLTREPEPLLDSHAVGSQPSDDEVLAETEHLLCLRPARPHGPGHLIVRARQPDASLLSLPPERLTELVLEVRRRAAELVAAHGACRIVAEAGARPATWHLYPGGST